MQEQTKTPRLSLTSLTFNSKEREVDKDSEAHAASASLDATLTNKG